MSPAPLPEWRPMPILLGILALAGCSKTALDVAGTGGSATTGTGGSAMGGTGGSATSGTGGSATSGTGGPSGVCPGPPAGGPAETWADCSAGLDPTKQGGDLLWALPLQVYPYGGCLCTTVDSIAGGPTGDSALGVSCWISGGEVTQALRFNGSGVKVGGYVQTYGLTSPSFQTTAQITRHNDLLTVFEVEHPSGSVSFLFADGAASTSWQDETTNEEGENLNGSYWPLDPWEADGLGNVFVAAHSIQPQKLDESLQLSPGTYLVRGGAQGESFQAGGFSGWFVADQTGGVYRFDTLPGPLDLGCGPMVPTTSASSYLARFDAAWGCVHARVLPAAVSVVADGSGGAVLSKTSGKALDLGCGSLPAAPGGSTFVTHLDPAGGCIAGVSLPAPGLTIAADPMGRIVVSGPVGAGSVDLGGGPLPPLGAQDLVLGVLDAAGHHVWSRRLGGPGAAFTGPRVTTTASGDVYLLTGASGMVDLGGGPLAGSTTMVGSYTASGAHRWSRAFSITGHYIADIDGCGALVVASGDPSFDPGCGTLLTPVSPGPNSPCEYYWPDANIAMARFQP